MPRRLAMVSLALLLAFGTARAQVPYGKDAIPGRRALARVNLDLHFATVVPLAGAEKLIQLSIDDGMMFAQTTHANFYAFDAETGRFLWSAHLGTVTTKARPVSVNSYAVYVSNSNSIFGLDRRTGRRMWEQSLTDIPSSSTAADENVVLVGLESGKLETFEAKTGKLRWNIQSNARVSSHPIVAGKVVVFGSEDKKLYLSKVETPQLLWRFATGGPIVAPLSTHGVRTLFVASSDRVLYSVDLFTGNANWGYATGSPVEQEPLVSDNDVYVINDEGFLTSVDIPTGKPKWTISTLGGRLIAVSATKVYLESHDDDLFVVDRATGKVVYDPATTFKRSGINLRDFVLGPTNRFDDRLYFATSHGLVICLREIAQVAPRPIRDPKEKPFGYVPPEGYPEGPPPPPVVPIEAGAEGAVAAPPVEGGATTPPVEGTKPK
jgi:outer membrane protein assembly factor BamB